VTLPAAMPGRRAFTLIETLASCILLALVAVAALPTLAGADATADLLRAEAACRRAESLARLASKGGRIILHVEPDGRLVVRNDVRGDVLFAHGLPPSVAIEIMPSAQPNVLLFIDGASSDHTIKLTALRGVVTLSVFGLTGAVERRTP
jgi:hypothetical protein